jgi:hypothetical protein
LPFVRRAVFAASRDRSASSIRTFLAKPSFIESRSSMKSANRISPVGCEKLTLPDAVTVSVRWL